MSKRHMGILATLLLGAIRQHAPARRVRQTDRRAPPTPLTAHRAPTLREGSPFIQKGQGQKTAAMLGKGASRREMGRKTHGNTRGAFSVRCARFLGAFLDSSKRLAHCRRQD